MTIRDKLREHAIWAEAWRNFPYEDTVGKVTIGVGRNLDDRGLSDDEVEYLLSNDLDNTIREAESLWFWPRLDEARQLVVADMIFNMGLSRFHGFVKTIDALERGDYQRAADEMVDSKWYRQTGRRAVKLVQIMRTGVVR